MACPICHRLYCDHTPEQRGQSFEEMMEDASSPHVANGTGSRRVSEEEFERITGRPWKNYDTLFHEQVDRLGRLQQEVSRDRFTQDDRKRIDTEFRSCYKNLADMIFVYGRYEVRLGVDVKKMEAETAKMKLLRDQQNDLWDVYVHKLMETGE
jgi:hypothetical protein